METLTGIEGYKLRIGDYRALIALDENTKIIDVLFIEHRKEIYKYLKREKFIAKK